MNLLEYQAKNLLAAHGIPIPKGRLVSSSADIQPPVVLKSQVPVGGRGKSGGIRYIKNRAEASEAYTTIRSLEIQGFLPSTIYAEEPLSINRELYVQLGINRDSSTIELIVHPVGGVDVEENASEGYYHIAIACDSEITSHRESIADALDLFNYTHQLEELLRALLECFVVNDAIRIEINPLILTTSGKLVAGDCKMILDDVAHSRHPEWVAYDHDSNHNFVIIDPLGTVATLANGAGLAMATVDAIYERGLSPANFLDIGGAASEETIVNAFHDIAAFSKVNIIVINIFGGIVQCDEVARAIVSARDQFPDLPRLLVRLSGTNSDIASRLLTRASIPFYDDFTEMLEHLS